jgi:glycerol-3-phosphate responsive antiterminator
MGGSGLFEHDPIIAAVKDDAGLAQCLQCDKKAVFVLYGSVLTIVDIVAQLKAAHKVVFVDIDLLDGLAAREVAVDYLCTHTHVDGVISTKGTLIRRAKERGLATVQRTFVLDSMALDGALKAPVKADYIELLPGLMPKIIRRVSAVAGRPVIASGLITDKEDVIAALGAGAAAVSSTNPAVWAL